MLSSLIQVARPGIHRFRRVFYRLLGIQDLVDGHVPRSGGADGLVATSDTYQRLMDRICILESHVNWRLHGLPAPLGNVRLEQAAAVAHSQDIVGVIRKLCEGRVDRRESEVLAEKLASAGRHGRVLVVGSYALIQGAFRVAAAEHAGVTLLADPEDVTSAVWAADVPEGAALVHTSPLNYLLALPDNALDLVWFSDALLRHPTLKQALLLREAVRVVKQRGIVAGLQTGSPLFASMQPVDWSILPYLGLPAAVVDAEGRAFSLTKQALQ